MAYKEGDILCVKLTGELVIVKNESDGRIIVSRPIMSHEDGISHETSYFHPYELETEEEHLAREGQSMILKFKAQRAVQKELDKLQDEEREEKKSSVDPALLVN